MFREGQTNWYCIHRECEISKNLSKKNLKNLEFVRGIEIEQFIVEMFTFI